MLLLVGNAANNACQPVRTLLPELVLDFLLLITCSPKPPETVSAHAALDPFGSLCFGGPGKARNSIETRVLTQFRGLGGLKRTVGAKLDDEAQDRT